MRQALRRRSHLVEQLQAAMYRFTNGGYHTMDQAHAAVYIGLVAGVLVVIYLIYDWWRLRRK